MLRSASVVHIHFSRRHGVANRLRAFSCFLCRKILEAWMLSRPRIQLSRRRGVPERCVHNTQPLIRCRAYSMMLGIAVRNDVMRQNSGPSVIELVAALSETDFRGDDANSGETMPPARV